MRSIFYLEKITLNKLSDVFTKLFEDQVCEGKLESNDRRHKIYNVENSNYGIVET